MTIDDLIDAINSSDNFSGLQDTIKCFLANERVVSSVDKYGDAARDVLGHLNATNGTRLKAIGKIAQRLSDGYSVADLKRIIDVKCDEWADNKKMAEYLKPQTLFGSRIKVDKYLDQVKLVDNFNKKEIAKSKPDSIVLPPSLLEWN